MARGFVHQVDHEPIRAHQLTAEVPQVANHAPRGEARVELKGRDVEVRQITQILLRALLPKGDFTLSALEL